MIKLAYVARIKLAECWELRFLCPGLRSELTGIPKTELEKLEECAQSLRKARIANATTQRGKIGRNEGCPCGSGKKFKRCLTR